MKKLLRKIAYSLTILLVLSACKKDEDAPDANTEPFLATHLKFDGKNDFLNVSGPISGVTDFTIEAKFLTKSEDTGYRRIIGWGGFDLEIVDQNGTIKVYYNGTWKTTTGTGIRDGQWHHVAVTRDATSLVVYLDGAQVFEGTGVSIDFDGLMAVGGKSSGGETWKGSIDEVRVWNVARSWSEIRAAVNTELEGTETGLQLYYDFNQMSSDTSAIDRTVNEHDGDFGGEGSDNSSDPSFSKQAQNDVALVPV